MRDNSFVVAPIGDHAFFEQAVLKRKIGHAPLQRTGLAAQVLDLIGSSCPCRIARHYDETQIRLKSQPQIWAIGADGEHIIKGQLTAVAQSRRGNPRLK